MKSRSPKVRRRIREATLKLVSEYCVDRNLFIAIGI
jgi:hypothetical protein